MRIILWSAVAAVLFIASPASAQWLMTLEADHPLVGKIWRPATKSFVTRGDVETAVGKADFALLGETHNNDDHHRLQAAMIEAMVKAGQKPGIAFEMITENKQPRVERMPGHSARRGVVARQSDRWYGSRPQC